jgi:phenylalanyl-tRNA synthetase alpha subunit
MEIFSYHKGLNKLIEIGNSGIFRPEMLEVCVHPSKYEGKTDRKLT